MSTFSRVLLLLLAVSGCAADPPEESPCEDSVYARNDADVAALEGCEAVRGSVYVWGEAVTSLAPLHALERVEGTLSIQTTSLQSMTGLEALAVVDNCLEMRDDDALVTLDGLEGLREIGGCLSIGTSSATGVDHGNDVLENVDALANVASVGGFATIENNPLLVDVGLVGLARIDGDLRIANNGALTSVDGLEAVTDFGGNRVAVANNPRLPHCQADELALRLASDVDTSGNDEQAACD